MHIFKALRCQFGVMVGAVRGRILAEKYPQSGHRGGNEYHSRFIGKPGRGRYLSNTSVPGLGGPEFMAGGWMKWDARLWSWPQCPSVCRRVLE